MKNIIFALSFLIATATFADESVTVGYLVGIKADLSGPEFVKCFSDLQGLTYDFGRHGWVVPMEVVSTFGGITLALDITDEGAAKAKEFTCVSYVDANQYVKPMPFVDSNSGRPHCSQE